LNLSKIEDYVHRSIAIILLLAIVVGIFYQPAAAAVDPYIAYFLMTVMFLSFMRVDVQLFKGELNHIGHHVWLLVLSMLIIPIIFYYLLYWFSLFTPGISPAFSVGALILFGTSTAVLAGPLTIIFNGNFERTILNSVFSTILVIATLPLLFVMLDASAVHFSFMQLFVFMFHLIMVPLIIAVILRTIWPSLTPKIAAHASALSVLLLFLVIMGCMTGLDYFFFNAYAYVIGALLSSAICLILCFILSWFLSFKRDYSDKVTTAIICTWVNTGLAVVIADKFFRQNNPDVILFVSLAVIPWNLMVFALKFLSSARAR